MGVLASGALFAGRYRVGGELGRGAMGRVFAARDEKLGREVALKLLMGGGFGEQRLRRFEQEARAAGGLNHPNIVAVFDIATEGSQPYLVSELLQGETLRQRLAAGPMPVKRAVDLALQLCQGLSAAHDKGVVHRDLKPENLILTREGRLKILDFGIAKLAEVEAPGGRGPLPTETGVRLGTPAYMAPEQVRGEQADQRSDLFAAGVVLFEMLAGARPFAGRLLHEVANEILTAEPPELPAAVPLELDRIVRRCLEKKPEARFPSATALALTLALLGTGEAGGLVAPRRTRRPWRALLAALVLPALAAAYLIGRSRPDVPPPTFQQLTFRRGWFNSAHFTPDGQGLVFAAVWDGQRRVYTGRIGSPETRSLDLDGAEVLSVSSQGELAIWLPPPGGREALLDRGRRVVARVSLSGGAPRELFEAVHATWAPDGSELAIVRNGALEFPPGKVLLKGLDIGAPRFSPSGQTIAFYSFGGLALVDRTGAMRYLVKDNVHLSGFAWHPSGKEIWFGGARPGTSRAQSLWAVDMAGRVRPLIDLPTNIVLHDVSAAGEALVAQETVLRPILALAEGETQEKDLSWFDLGNVCDLSRDGKTMAVHEFGDAARNVIYLRRLDGSPAVKLGPGTIHCALSPDGRWVVTGAIDPDPKPESRDALVLLPTGVGAMRTLPFSAASHLANLDRKSVV